MIPASVRIFVCQEPVDMRRSFDGLALAVRQHLGEDPEGGAVFVFANRRGNRLKVLWLDVNGYCILYKRLHRARFELPPPGSRGKARFAVSAAELGRILRGVETSGRSRKAA